jgi:hypothetical protein
MNRQMNLPALQRIAMEFERENDIMDQRQEMMDDAIDDVTGLEDEEEGEEVVQQVLDEIGIDLGQAVSTRVLHDSLKSNNLCSLERHHPASRRLPLRKAGLHRQLAEQILEPTMTCKRVLTVCVGNTIHVLTIRWRWRYGVCGNRAFGVPRVRSCDMYYCACGFSYIS